MRDNKGFAKKYEEIKEFAVHLLFLLVCFTYCMLLFFIVSFVFHAVFIISFNQILIISLIISIVATLYRIHRKKKVVRNIMNFHTVEKGD